MIRKPTRKTSQAFTMVEIMIVVLILGMLMAIAIPHYVRQRSVAQAQTCVNNLVQINNAAEQFALERGKKTGDLLSYPQDLTPYIKLNSAGRIPACPAGGSYSMSTVGLPPACSLGSSVSPPHLFP